MILSINTDNNTIIFDRFFRNPIQKLVFQRHNSGVLKVSFTDQQIALGSRMVQFAIKPHKQYDFANFLVYANSYNLEGAYFAMSPTFNVVAIQQLFPLSSIESVMLSLQLRWSDDSGITWAYSNVIDAEVNNSIFAGGELSSFQISSFLSQVVPILESYTWPINLFNTELSLNNSNLVMSGSATGIVMSGGSNYITLSAPSSWVKVGTVLSNSLSTNVVNALTGTIGNLSSVQINTTSLNTDTATIGTLNITQLEVGGFNIIGNLSAQGTVAGNLITTTSTPATSAALGTVGSISYDNNYLYVKTVSAWKRVPLSDF